MNFTQANSSTITKYYANIGKVRIRYLKFNDYSPNKLYKMSSIVYLCDRLALDYDRGFNRFNSKTLEAILSYDKIVNMPTVIRKIDLAPENEYKNIW